MYVCFLNSKLTRSYLWVLNTSIDILTPFLFGSQKNNSKCTRGGLQKWKLNHDTVERNSITVVHSRPPAEESNLSDILEWLLFQELLKKNNWYIIMCSACLSQICAPLLLLVKVWGILSVCFLSPRIFPHWLFPHHPISLSHLIPKKLQLKQYLLPLSPPVGTYPFAYYLTIS